MSLYATSRDRVAEAWGAPRAAQAQAEAKAGARPIILSFEQHLLQNDLFQISSKTFQCSKKIFVCVQEKFEVKYC